MNDSSYKKIKPERKYPEVLKSVVDKSSFMPNVSDVRNLLTSEKIGQPVTALYDFYKGETEGFGNYAISHGVNDITEMDKAIEIQKSKANENLKKAVREGQKMADKLAEMQKQEVTTSQMNSGKNG